MTIRETLFALVVVYTQAVLIYILGVAWFITKQKYLDLKRHYSDFSPLPSTNTPEINKPIAPNTPIKFGTSELSGKAIAPNLSKNIPPSTETTMMLKILMKLPMSRIIGWFTE